MEKIVIDGEELYVEKLVNFSEDGVRQNSLRDVFRTTSEAFKKALHPIVIAGKALKSSVLELQPDEIEVAFEVQMGTDGQNPIFGIGGASAEGHMAVKFVWKKDAPST